MIPLREMAMRVGQETALEFTSSFVSVSGNFTVL
jgi:hypothetical protein